MRLALAALLALAACSPQARDQVTRDAARAAIHPVVAERFPGVPLEQAIDCVIDNATSGELLGLAADSVTGPTAATTQTVATIATRPGTVRCLAADGVSAFLR